MSVTDTLIRFVLDTATADIPAIARARAIASIADTIGVMLVGSRSDVVESLLGALGDAGALTGGHLLLGLPYRASALDAALVNGVSAHALDFDDVSHPGPMHPGCHLVPTLLAVSELIPVSGADLLEAFVIGFEIDGKLGRLMNPRHYDEGWHATSTIGTVAATAAAARLLRLSWQRIEHCFAIAASSAAGLRGNLGSMTKPLHAGGAARAALQAALLARRGFTGVSQVFDHKHGYLAAFGYDLDPERGHLMDLGRTWELETEFGIGLKPYPCCGEAESAVECGVILSAEFDATKVERIVVRTNERATNILTYSNPQDVEQARFSMQFCVATALISGRADLAAFSEAAVADPEIRALISRVEHVVDESHRNDREFGCVMDITLSDGRRLHHKVPLTKGWSDRWLSAQEQRAKFLMCAEGVLDPTSATELQQALIELDSIDDVSALLTRLATVGAGA